MRAWIAVICMAGLLGGCAGLSQFPVASTNYEEDLGTLDPDYAKALADIQTNANDPDEQERIRNEEIDRRLRVIDLHFAEFQKGLARENVGADFLVGVTEVGVGAAGALVAETVSQILSAVSGGLAGTRAAYTKAALFEKTLSALLGQMIAGRNSILANIYDGRTRDIDEYPLSAAVRDLEAYNFAGSLPGAVVGTAADATVKNSRAEGRLEAFRTNIFSEDESGNRIGRFLRPPDGDLASPVNQANVQALRNWIDQSPVAGLPIANFLTNPDLRNLREQAISEIPIP